MLVLAYEWPVPWIRMATRLEKDELEAFHLQRFSTDHRLALGRVAFDAADKGDNPPDYRVVTGTRIIGVDCTALTIQERRQAHALFVNLRRRIFQVAPATLAQLAGFMVYLWFLGVESISLPFRQNDDAAIDELLAALQEYRPNPAQLVVADDRGLPDPAPNLGAISTQSGAPFYAVPNLNSAPDTAFSAVTGFELGLAYTTRHSPSAGWKEVDRLVGSHDKEGVDWLLISAGAPNRDGQTFQTEELYARFLLQNARPLSAPSHITRVTLHL